MERSQNDASNHVPAGAAPLAPAHLWQQTKVRVRYAETDQAGVVYHANYLVWFEVGRVELCRAYGFNYREMETEADAFLPVTECRVKYRNPARYDDELIVRTRVLELRSRAVSFGYEVRRASDGLLLAEGETHHIVINRAGRARAFPPHYAALMRGPLIGNDDAKANQTVPAAQASTEKDD